MARPGADLEKAVFDFARTLDPQAEVIFNRQAPDRDTGTPRQCDVWINANFGGHWPLSILVSCKDHGRPLDIGDIGTFCDEIRSTGANMGVIYSRTGFTQPALGKAKANSISCCRLYQGEPADIPTPIFLEQFICAPKHWLFLESSLAGTCLKTWNDLFSLPEGDKTIVEVIGTQIEETEAKAIKESEESATFPPDWELRLMFKPDETRPEIAIRVLCRWTCYRAQAEATLLNGSYCLSNGSYAGDVLGPFIDLQGPHPGDAWKEITDRSICLPVNRMLWEFLKGNMTDDLRSLGAETLPIRETRADC